MPLSTITSSVPVELVENPPARSQSQNSIAPQTEPQSGAWIWIVIVGVVLAVVILILKFA